MTDQKVGPSFWDDLRNPPKPQRILSISAKCSDMCWAEVKHLKIEGDGYAPNIPYITEDGDYVTFDLDLDTGKIIGYTPISDADLKAAIKGM